jgi:hypothetical protein
MAEINKLRTRLKNVQKNVVEYRMTIAEAFDLLKEIDELLIPKVVDEVHIVEQPVSVIKVVDGGSF